MFVHKEYSHTLRLIWQQESSKQPPTAEGGPEAPGYGGRIRVKVRVSVRVRVRVRVRLRVSVGISVRVTSYINRTVELKSHSMKVKGQILK